MARYILQNNIALRSWSDLPYACCVRGKMYPRTLSKKEFLTLLRCDGTEEADASPLLSKLLAEGLIREAAAAGETLNRMKASLFGVPVRVMEMHDGSALGAVKAAGGSLKVEGRVFEPEKALTALLRRRFSTYRVLYEAERSIRRASEMEERT